MDHHFRAFSFVDRIVSVQPGVKICGSYNIPPNIEAFPVALVAEAVGQLAAWATMAAVDFERRPVAGLARTQAFDAGQAGLQFASFLARCEALARFLIGDTSEVILRFYKQRSEQAGAL